MAGLPVLLPDVDLGSGWRQARQVIRDAYVSKIEGKQVWITDTAVTYDEESWDYVLIPIYVFRYVFEDQNHYGVMDGANGEMIGELAMDKTAVLLHKLLYFIPFVVVLGVATGHQIGLYIREYQTFDFMLTLLPTTVWGIAGFVMALALVIFDKYKSYLAAIVPFMMVFLFAILNGFRWAFLLGTSLVLLFNFALVMRNQIDKNVAKRKNLKGLVHDAISQRDFLRKMFCQERILWASCPNALPVLWI